MKFLFFLSLTMFSFFAQAQPHTQVDQMPYFNGVDHLKSGSAKKRNESNKKIIAFLNEHLIYPDSAKINGIEGTIFLRFTVDRAGQVKKPTLLYNIGYGCGEEALRIINLMPQWEPATKEGAPVEVTLDLPVKFEALGESTLPGYTLVWGDLDQNVLTKKKLIQLLKTPLIVLNEHGEEIDLLELKVRIIKNNIIIREKLSDGSFTKSQKRLTRRLRRNQILELVGTVQKGGKFYYIHRELKCNKCFFIHIPFS